MIRPGEYQTLEVLRVTPSGAYLAEPGGDPSCGGRVPGAPTDPASAAREGILLPGRQIPAGIAPGNRFEVFVYRDSEDRLIATTRRPLLTVGKLAALRVVEVTPIGAFLAWGLEKDLLLPHAGWRGAVRKDDVVVVTLLLDEKGRPYASMKFAARLAVDSPYKFDDTVEGTVYDLNSEMGAFVAVDDRYHGMIPLAELFPPPRLGDRVKARVTRVREDGKLDLSLRAKAFLQMEPDAEAILALIARSGGRTHLHDKSEPEAIKAALGLSKAAFKRAVGRLLKARKIVLFPDGIGLATDPSVAAPAGSCDAPGMRRPQDPPAGS